MGLRHLDFFEALAQLDETDPAWREVTAGLVVLRLVDAWIEDGPAVVAANSWMANGVRLAIAEIPSTRPTRGILTSIVDAMEASESVDVHAVSPRLLAYGRALDFDARWTLASDVYRTVAAHADPVDDADSATAAHLRLGYCLRQVGELSASVDAYHTAGQIAAAANDLMGVLRARIGDAKAAILRGNFPHAESILDSTILEAAHHGLTAVESMALHDRSQAAGLCGNYELAIRLAYRALDKSTTPHDRDRILHDIATSFYNLGVRSAARDAYLVLAATAQEQYLRWAATVQLLAIAADDRMSPIFERYRRELSDCDLPPTLAVDFCHQTGRGYRIFAERIPAGEWLTRALATAREFSLHQEVYVIEAELERLLHGDQDETSPIALNHHEAPPEVVDVAEAMREMRVAVAGK